MTDWHKLISVWCVYTLMNIKKEVSLIKKKFKSLKKIVGSNPEKALKDLDEIKVNVKNINKMILSSELSETMKNKYVKDIEQVEDGVVLLETNLKAIIKYYKKHDINQSKKRGKLR